MAATDAGSPPLASNTTLSVAVTDINDNPPVFNASSFNFEVSENLPSGTEVGVFEVSDRDRGAAAENVFTLTGQGSERFSVETISVIQMSSATSQPPIVTVARVITSQALDREDVDMYQLLLTAQDQTSVPLSATVPVVVTVADVNDNDPVFPSPVYAFSISEGTSNLLVMNFTVSELFVGGTNMYISYLCISFLYTTSPQPLTLSMESPLY